MHAGPAFPAPSDLARERQDQCKRGQTQGVRALHRPKSRRPLSGAAVPLPALSFGSSRPGGGSPQQRGSPLPGQHGLHRLPRAESPFRPRACRKVRVSQRPRDAAGDSTYRPAALSSRLFLPTTSHATEAGGAPARSQVTWPDRTGAARPPRHTPPGGRGRPAASAGWEPLARKAFPEQDSSRQHGLFSGSRK